MIRVEARAHHKGTYTDVTLILPFKHTVDDGILHRNVEQRLRREFACFFSFPIIEVEIREVGSPQEAILIHRGIHPYLAPVG